MSRIVSYLLSIILIIILILVRSESEANCVSDGGWIIHTYFSSNDRPAAAESALLGLFVILLY